jgi:hypothetical protein
MEYLILSENNHPSINHDFLRKNRLGFRCREFRLVYLKREQTFRYNGFIFEPKSNKSPTRKIASASPLPHRAMPRIAFLLAN